jgi:hypothetical protein
MFIMAGDQSSRNASPGARAEVPVAAANLVANRLSVPWLFVMADLAGPANS